MRACFIRRQSIKKKIDEPQQASHLQRMMRRFTSSRCGVAPMVSRCLRSTYLDVVEVWSSSSGLEIVF